MNIGGAVTAPTTTLARIREYSPCEPGYKTLCKGLGGIRKYGEDTPINVRQIVEINGLDDALRCLLTMPEHNPRWRLLAVRYARRVQHLMVDPRSLKVLDVAKRHARGLATDAELEAAAAAAWAAALDAEDDVTEAAARASAMAAEGDAGGAAGAAAEAVAVEAAAEFSADAAAAALASAAAAEVSAAEGAAWTSERQWQAEELIRISEEEV